MFEALKGLAGLAANKGTTVNQVVEAVKYAVNWLSRQSYGQQVFDAYKNVAFTVSGIPNFGKAGGTLTVTKAAGTNGLTGSTSRTGSFKLTLDGFINRAKNVGSAPEVDADEAQRQADEAEKAAAEAARKAEEARVAAQKAREQKAQSGELRSAVARFFGGAR